MCNDDDDFLLSAILTVIFAKHSSSFSTYLLPSNDIITIIFKAHQNVKTNVA